MTYRYLRNLRDTKTSKTDDLSKFPTTKPKFKSKADYREWCGDPKTNHVFYSTMEGRAPSKRISSDNPVHKIHGIVADYDSPIDWNSFQINLNTSCAGTIKPTWSSKTYSGYLRLVWEFEESIPIDPSMFDSFISAMNLTLKISKLFAGFDTTSFRANQYFELGEDWERTNDPVTMDIVHAALSKAVNSKPPESSDTTIPIPVIAEEVESRFPNRWFG